MKGATLFAIFILLLGLYGQEGKCEGWSYEVGIAVKSGNVSGGEQAYNYPNPLGKIQVTYQLKDGKVVGYEHLSALSTKDNSFMGINLVYLGYRW